MKKGIILFLFGCLLTTSMMAQRHSHIRVLNSSSKNKTTTTTTTTTTTKSNKCRPSAKYHSMVPTHDVVYLKDGGVIYGRILDYNLRGSIKIQAADGTRFKLKSSKIARVEKGNSNEMAKDGRPNDIVYLKNGGIIYGKITEYKSRGPLKITASDGVNLKLSRAYVSRIVKGTPN